MHPSARQELLELLSAAAGGQDVKLDVMATSGGSRKL
jgi:hypothetical protein